MASVHKKWVTLRDQMGVSITGDVDHRIIIGAVIVIEHIEVTEKQSSSGAWSMNARFLNKPERADSDPSDSRTRNIYHQVVIGAVIAIEHVEVTERQSHSGSMNINI